MKKIILLNLLFSVVALRGAAQSDEQFRVAYCSTVDRIKLVRGVDNLARAGESTEVDIWSNAKSKPKTEYGEKANLPDAGVRIKNKVREPLAYGDHAGDRFIRFAHTWHTLVENSATKEVVIGSEEEVYYSSGFGPRRITPIPVSSAVTGRLMADLANIRGSMPEFLDKARVYKQEHDEYIADICASIAAGLEKK